MALAGMRSRDTISHGSGTRIGEKTGVLMATQKESGPISRAVREALSTLVSPQMCEQLIRRSLASQGLEAVPESGTEIGEWLEGSLRGEVETAVGPDAADLMMMELGPIAAYAAIAVPSVAAGAPKAANDVAPTKVERESESDISGRPTQLRFDAGAHREAAELEREPAPKAASSAFASDPPTGVFKQPADDGGAVASYLAQGRSPAPEARTLVPVKPSPTQVPAKADRTGKISTRGSGARPLPQPETANGDERPLPMVLTATSNRQAFEALRGYLGRAARVVHVPDLVGLLDTLEEPDAVEPVVLIDCHSPTLHISSVSAIGEDLPRGTTVVLWGVDEPTWQQLDRDRAPACRWVRCSSEATTDDVGSLCSMLLG